MTDDRISYFIDKQYYEDLKELKWFIDREFDEIVEELI
jgi:hypothetical protein